jgi:uncharacterized protein
MMTFRAMGLGVTAALLLPVAAQAQFSESYNFLKGVRDRDGEAVTKILNKPGSGAVIINTRDNSTGEAAIHIVTKRRDTTWLSFLLAKGANADMRDAGGNSALMLAVQNRDLATVRTLLTAGANPNKADTGAGLSARQYAERDPRAGAILAAINDAKPKAKPKVGPS